MENNTPNLTEQELNILVELYNGSKILMHSEPQHKCCNQYILIKDKNHTILPSKPIENLYKLNLITYIPVNYARLRIVRLSSAPS